MNKNRLEALSDGVFSIIMTILVFEISLPTIRATPTNAEILADLQTLIPLFLSYFISFAVLAMFWMSHNFFYSSFTREINRTLVLLNFIYLSFLSLIPFTARLMGEYDTLNVAVAVYGVNVLIIGLLATTVLHYAIYSDEIDISHVAPRLMNQARVRSLLTPFSALLGIVASLFNVHVALFFFAFPIIFNLLPGSLTFVEKALGLKF